jgi:hypothetical protein
MSFILKQISSLEKVYLDSESEFFEIKSGNALKGERFSYQLAFKSDTRFFAQLDIFSQLKEYITIRSVGNVPSELPAYPDSDSYYERTKPGLFPDVLFPIDNDKVPIKPNNWYSFWITVELPCNIKAGDYAIDIRISEADSILNENRLNIDEKKTLKLRVIDAVLPEQKLIYTQWFHSDCIANYYNVPVFSQRYWELTEKFMAMAAHTGVNMILTPIFTPPLDTAVGGERLTVQLVDVYYDGKSYKFNFDKLRQWIMLAKKSGIKYFEISHLFSQWGAYATPKVIANVNGAEKRIFGWNTPSDSGEYIEFLHSFLPELIEVIKAEKIEKNTMFHISDEPSLNQIGSYSKAKSSVAEYLKDFTIIDALSEYDFYKNGIISTPVASLNNIESFIENGVGRRWTYYCCGQNKDVSNRFFGMPLSRTRIIGVQLFKYKIEGFLQWGYNFYNSAKSTRAINPFLVTDADSAFPSGDAFTVYPYTYGPIESVRAVTFYEGLQDMRALELLSDNIGYDKTVKKLVKKFGNITFSDYPRGVKNMLEIRNEINSLIKKNI